MNLESHEIDKEALRRAKEENRPILLTATIALNWERTGRSVGFKALAGRACWRAPRAPS